MSPANEAPKASAAKRPLRRSRRPPVHASPGPTKSLGQWGEPVPAPAGTGSSQCPKKHERPVQEPPPPAPPTSTSCRNPADPGHLEPTPPPHSPLWPISYTPFSHHPQTPHPPTQQNTPTAQGCDHGLVKAGKGMSADRRTKTETIQEEASRFSFSEAGLRQNCQAGESSGITAADNYSPS